MDRRISPNKIAIKNHELGFGIFGWFGKGVVMFRKSGYFVNDNCEYGEEKEKKWWKVVSVDGGEGRDEWEMGGWKVADGERRWKKKK